LAAATAPETDHTVVVDYYNWEAFMVFADCGSQWRIIVPAMGEPMMTGLDYSSVAAVMQIMRTKNRAETFQRVRLIERGALAAFRGVQLDDLIWGND